MRHGGAWDRGSADAQCGRDYNPHYYRGASYSSELVEVLSECQIEAYYCGYYGHKRKIKNKE